MVTYIQIIHKTPCIITGTLSLSDVIVLYCKYLSRIYLTMIFMHIFQYLSFLLPELIIIFIQIESAIDINS